MSWRAMRGGADAVPVQDHQHPNAGDARKQLDEVDQLWKAVNDAARVKASTGRRIAFPVAGCGG